MVSLHYFIFVIILTDSKDEKKNTKNVFYETDQTLYLCREWRYSITLELVAVLIYFLERIKTGSYL